MPGKEMGWLCGRLVNKFSTQAQVFQRAAKDFIGKIMEEFPSIVELNSSQQYISPNGTPCFTIGVAHSTLHIGLLQTQSAVDIHS
ncbi:hypothetical protein FKM82_028238 [Ascaphus truei]